jgi:hypothetical protein
MRRTSFAAHFGTARKIMSIAETNLKSNMFRVTAWLVVLPFLAVWPFLSALPAFSLIGYQSFDLTASLNIVFLLSGFWPLAVVVLAIFWLTRGNVGEVIRSGKGLLLGNNRWNCRSCCGYGVCSSVFYSPTKDRSEQSDNPSALYGRGGPCDGKH